MCIGDPKILFSRLSDEALELSQDAGKHKGPILDDIEYRELPSDGSVSGEKHVVPTPAGERSDKAAEGETAQSKI